MNKKEELILKLILNKLEDITKTIKIILKNKIK